MKTAYMTIGIGASGKSTYLNETFPDLQHISADAFRIVEGEYLFDPDREGDVWKRVKLLIAIACDAGRDFVFEATNLTKVRREPYLTMMKKYNYTIIALYFDTPLSTCLERNEQRKDNRRIPDETLKKMHLNREMPSITEGFAAVKIIREGRAI